MGCVLMESNGLRGDCATNGCVYWALFSGPGEQPRRGCALDFFGLVGPRPDRLSKWLLELKLKSRGGRHSEISLSDSYAPSARLRANACSTMGGGYVPRRERSGVPRISSGAP